MRQIVSTFERRPRFGMRVWLYVIGLLWLSIVGPGVILAIYDRLHPTPLVVASLEVRDVEGRVKVHYLTDARVASKGTWTAFIEFEGGVKGPRRTGCGDYSPARAGSLWGWKEFWTDKCNPVPPPAVPARPFRLCVFYDLTALRSDYRQDIAPSCSEVFSP